MRPTRSMRAHFALVAVTALVSWLCHGCVTPAGCNAFDTDACTYGKTRCNGEGILEECLGECGTDWESQRCSFDKPICVERSNDRAECVPEPTSAARGCAGSCE